MHIRKRKQDNTRGAMRISAEYPARARYTESTMIINSVVAKYTLCDISLCSQDDTLSMVLAPYFYLFPVTSALCMYALPFWLVALKCAYGRGEVSRQNQIMVKIYVRIHVHICSQNVRILYNTISITRCVSTRKRESEILLGSCRCCIGWLNERIGRFGDALKLFLAL